MLKIQFRKQDGDVLPDRFKADNSEAALSEDYFNFVRLPNNTKCQNAKVAITVKSSADHFGKIRAISENVSKGVI